MDSLIEKYLGNPAKQGSDAAKQDDWFHENGITGAPDPKRPGKYLLKVNGNTKAVGLTSDEWRNKAIKLATMLSSRKKDSSKFGLKKTPEYKKAKDSVDTAIAGLEKMITDFEEDLRLSDDEDEKKEIKQEIDSYKKKIKTLQDLLI